jgi:hypothetical protein
MPRRAYLPRIEEVTALDPQARVSSDHPLVRLQRQIGNRAVQELLQRQPAYSFKPVKDLTKGKFGDWQARPAGATDAELFEDLVLLADATTVKSVMSTWGAVSRITSLNDAKPGLNYFNDLGVPGITGYIDATGNFTPTLPVTKSDVPAVAIVLGSNAFDRDRAFALSTLRHEMRHAIHFENAIDQLQAWQRSGGGKGFEPWLESRRMSAVERALLKERIAGTRENTEVLAWMEGVITGLPFLPSGPGLGKLIPNYPVAIAQLLGAGKFYVASSTSDAVKTLALENIQGYCCGELDAAQRQTLAAWVSFLQERSQGEPLHDPAGAEIAKAAHRVFNDFSPLQVFLRDVLAAIRKPCPKVAKSGHDLAASRGDITPALKALKDAELRELDAAAATDPKLRPLREKIAAELFTRHKSAVKAFTPQISVTTAGKVQRHDPVDGGTVEIQTGVQVATPIGSATDAFSLTFRPAGDSRVSDERWLQFTWREIYTELPAARHGGDPPKHHRAGLLEWSGGFPYQLTVDAKQPHWNTDSPSTTDPFAEEIRTRKADELTMFDIPSSNIEELKPLFADPHEHPTKGVSHFHQDMFLVRGRDVIYHASIDERWEVSSSTDTPKLSVTVQGPLAKLLDPAQRERLLSQYPSVDFLRDF